MLNTPVTTGACQNKCLVLTTELLRTTLHQSMPGPLYHYSGSEIRSHPYQVINSSKQSPIQVAQ